MIENKWSASHSVKWRGDFPPSPLRAPKAAEKAKLEEKFVMTRQSKKGVEKEVGKFLNGIPVG